MKKNARELLGEAIQWIKVPGKPQWAAMVFGEKATLKMNSFPDEPLYTLLYGGLALDLEQAPECWAIPRAP